ncbi:DeoR/GlpR family DNA-binding transcription regulator [Psittacicella gerlachiana]|uniref:HTH deoR-type domain-containing protein n=1 Tax=Psittacicella gerlachiana TaxID=2028574 RepID=A0A3A1YH40_9GAMM|nr:DeoR/GlpR family DNA-binding transcription regulator [Psittacicella gerlachiana]RIY37462.1 hypothetical protein CKF59_01715 [Psittacicella gerlachiana]
MKATQQRRLDILNLVNSIGIVSISHLAYYFKVSKVTIRSDVDALESQGKLIKVHGCIKSLNLDEERSSLQFDQEFSFLQKQNFQHPIKTRLALAALALIKDGTSILLDAGTTVYELAVQISKRTWQNLTVITPSLPVCDLLSTIPGITIVLLGGKLNTKGKCFIGEQTQTMLTDLHYDQLFFAVDGYHIDYGLTTHYGEEAVLNRQMIQQAGKVIVIADHTKFARHAKHKIVDFDVPDMVITDEQIHPDYQGYFAQTNVELKVVR